MGAPTTNGWSNELYGFTLYHSPNNSEFYAFGCDYSSMIQQYRIYCDIAGNINLELKRTFQNGSIEPTEGMVADNESALPYAGREDEGIYVYYADEGMTVNPVRFLEVEDEVLAADIEGLCIYYAANDEGYLIASSQGQDYFSVYKRNNENSFVGTYTIEGVSDTDGIDVLSTSVNSTFPFGFFICHNGGISPTPIHLVRWDDISDDITPSLSIDTAYWNPRRNISTGFDFSNFDNKQKIFVTQNPVSTRAGIRFSLNKQSKVNCSVYDAQGKLIEVIIDTTLQAGDYSFVWNRETNINLKANQILYFRLNIDNVFTTRKIAIL